MTSIPCCTPNNGAVLTLLTGLVNNLYDSYCNIEDPRKYPTDIEPSFEYDYVIVGGTDAGCVLGSRLTENPDLSVLIIEEGGPPSAASNIPSLEYAVQASCDAKKYKTKPTPGKCKGFKNGQCVIFQPKVLGGISSTSNNLYLRGSYKDYDDWADITKCPEYSYDNVLPIFKKSENYWKENKYHAKGGYININKLTQTGDEITQTLADSFKLLNYEKIDPNDADTEIGFEIADMFLKDGQKENLAESYLGVAKHRENLYVSYKSKAKKLLYDKDCNRIYGVEYTKHGVTRKVRAKKEVIVALDTFSAPQLFMVSGFGPRADLQTYDIEVLKELPDMGQNLKYHIWMPYGGFSITNNTFLNTPVLSTNELFEYLTNKTGNLANINYKDNIALLSSDGSKRPNFYIYFYILKKQSTDYDYALDRYELTDEMKTLTDENKKHASMYIYTNPLKANCGGHLTITSRNTDNPVDITPNILSSESDKNDIIKMGDIMTRFIETEPMKALGLEFINFAPELETAQQDEVYRRELMKIFAFPYEETGTCSMGKIVDCDFKLYDVNGVRIAGPSVIPLNIAGNVNIATIMMAEKLAEKILNGS